MGGGGRVERGEAFSRRSADPFSEGLFFFLFPFPPFLSLSLSLTLSLSLSLCVPRSLEFMLFAPYSRSVHDNRA